jgi:transposase
VLSLSATIKQTLGESTDALARLTGVEQENQQLKAHNQHLCERNTLLEEELKWLRGQFYGRSSEKSAAAVSADQRMLFNEAEVLAAIAKADSEEQAKLVKIQAHERQNKPGRKAIPTEFPRTVVLHDIPESEKICPVDGAVLKCFGKEISEQYDYKPPQLTVLRHERPKYACPCCHEGVKIAPPPAQLLPKSLAAPSLLAHITTAKFVDGLPLTRQSKQFARLGLDIGAGTMGGWINTIGAEKLVPLIELMNEALLAEPFIHCDETPVQVLKSEKAPTSDHYMYGLEPPDRPVGALFCSTMCPLAMPRP